MDYDKSNDIKKDANTISVSLSAGENEIKYYECNNDNCIFEIVDKDCDTKQEIKSNKHDEYLNEPRTSRKDNIDDGKIEVKAFLDCGTQEVLEGVKVNLYKINGLSPILVKSKITDSNGTAVFSDVKEGNYRVIEIINKKYFQKPKYINWNEVTIDSSNKTDSITVINKIKDKYLKKRYMN